MKNSPEKWTPDSQLSHATKFEVCAPFGLYAPMDQNSILLPIPRIYWDALQASLNTEVKRLAKDIAATLHQPEQPLLKALQGTVGAYLFEEEAHTMVDLAEMRCKAMVRSTENQSVITQCSQPILLGKGTPSGVCQAHLHVEKEPTPTFITHLKIIKDYTGETYWMDSDNCLRRKGDLKCIGRYDPERKTCILMELEEIV